MPVKWITRRGRVASKAALGGTDEIGWPLDTRQVRPAASALQVRLPIGQAAPVTRTVSIYQLCFQRPLNEIITGKGGFCVSTVSIVCTHASVGVRSGPSGPITPTVLTMLTMPS